MSRFGVFKINGIEFDLDDLTLDEVEDLENAAGGVPFGELNFGSAKVMKAIAFVLMKRTSPDIRIEDIGSTRMIDMLPADEEAPPLPRQGGDESPSESDPADSGPQLSAVSTSG